jgi:hypothetical protein
MPLCVIIAWCAASKRPCGGCFNQIAQSLCLHFSHTPQCTTHPAQYVDLVKMVNWSVLQRLF